MQAKGKTFLTTNEFIVKKYGKDKFSRFYTDNRNLNEINSFNDLELYPLELLLEFMEKIDKYFGFGDGSLMFESGLFSAKKSFNESLKLFKNLSVKDIISNAQALFSSFYSQGEVEIEYLENTKITLKLINMPCNLYLTKRLEGWLTESFKIAGAKSVEITELAKKCPHFTIKWKE